MRTKTPMLLSILALELVLIDLYIPCLIVAAIATLIDEDDVIEIYKEKIERNRILWT